MALLACITVWWFGQSKAKLSRVSGPPCERFQMWCDSAEGTSHTRGTIKSAELAEPSGVEILYHLPNALMGADHLRSVGMVPFGIEGA